MPDPAAPLAATTHRPLPETARLTGGPLGDWQDRNAAATLPHCLEQLEAAGVLDNLRVAAGESSGPHRGFCFADSDLYKTIEAVGWEIGRSGTTAFDAWLDDVIGLLARAQEPDGYLDSYIQVAEPALRWAELDRTHELYLLGHLVQAAIALDRGAGRVDLLAVASRFVDLVHAEFGGDRSPGICGHPEIETALVELYRHTGERRHLDLAALMIDRRGHGTLSPDPLRAPYFQDHLPVRESTDAVGHAVRQLYLNAGATDVALETGDPGLRAAMDAQWASVHDRKMYLTGAYGSRHAGEAFGDDHELPADVAYAETCATIADLHWAWRMLLADGGAGAAAYAAAMERDTHNALAAAVDGTGTRFFYANPLQLRPDRLSGESTTRDRVPWFACACCPPNIARTVAQYGAYLASTRDATLHLHQLAAAELALPAELGAGGVRVATDYPRSGRIEVEVSGAPAAGAELAVRVPDWSPAADLVAPDGRRHARGSDGYARAPLTPGSYALDLDLTPRFTRGHHRVDAVRGCVAVERGPIVYCVEQVDLPADVAVDDLRVLLDRGIGVDAAGGLHVTCVVAAAEDGLYRPEAPVAAGGREVDVPLVPFAEWGRRGSPAMRVWLPTA